MQSICLTSHMNFLDWVNESDFYLDDWRRTEQKGERIAKQPRY